MKRALVLFTLLFALGISVAVSSHVQAQSTTPSAEIRRMIRERIEQTIQEKAPREDQLFGILGSIQKVGESTFTITDTLGRERTVQLADGAVMKFNNQNFTLKDLSINSGAAIIGQMVDDIVIEANRVYITDSAFPERRQVSVGTITAWKNNELSMSIRGSQATATWKTSRRPILEDSLGNTIVAKNIQPDQAALVVTEEDTAGNRQIIRLRLLIPVESAAASPSPTPRATPRPASPTPAQQ